MCSGLSRLCERFDLDWIAACCLLAIAGIIGFCIGYAVCVFEAMEALKAL